MIRKRVYRWALLVWIGVVSCRGTELVWVELTTSGIPAEMAPFYEKTFGWTSERTGPGVRDAVVLARNGRPVAGVVFRAGERGERPRSRWVGFFGVADLSGASGKVAERGGRVWTEEHRGALGTTRAVLAADAEGAVFGLVAREGREPARGFWPVALVRDPEAATQFYRGVLGGEVRGEPRTPLFGDDFVLTAEGNDRAGVQPAGVGGGAGWLILVGVADIEAATRAARRAGGRVLREPTIDLIGGRVAVIADPLGGVFGLYEALPVDGRGAASGGTKAGKGREVFEVEVLPR
jgi:predicted enzyme related to lactoylglutathione lyase